VFKTRELGQNFAQGNERDGFSRRRSFEDHCCTVSQKNMIELSVEEGYGGDASQAGMDQKTGF
jgi:hypothetical protein